MILRLAMLAGVGAGTGRALLLLLLFLGGPVFGQTVTARSGEHDGFTRIVLEYGAPVDWTVGRMPDGYALRVKEVRARYDLTGVFNRIGKSRLGAIWADPETGDLVFSANCPCHAIAFEFRPGTVVIDLKDGAPPAGSGFETALSESDAAASAGVADTAPRPKPRPAPTTEAVPEYDWTRNALTIARPANPVTAADTPSPVVQAATTKPVAETSEQTQAALAEFEENLRAELAGAATSGIVDLAEPGQVSRPLGEAALDQFRIGRKGEATLGQTTSRQAELGAEGETCASDESLAIADWGDPERPVAEQIAEMRNELVGEFDAVNDEKLKATIRFLLYLGFGTEVRDMLASFSPNAPEAAQWTAMAQVLEGEDDSSGFFVSMMGCQGPAALWAVLAHGDQPKAGFDRKPVLLAFSSLPVHLRRHLGPRLVDRFLTMGDDEGARILSDAIFRPGATDAPGIDLMKARISLEKGDTTETEAILRERIAAAGPDQAEAYFTLVELMAAQRRPMQPDEALAVAALIEEYPDSAKTRRISALAQAAASDFSAAFAEGSPAPGASAEIWGLLATIGSDDDLLRHAVMASDAQPGEVQPADAIRIAERLLALGLPKESLRWQNWAGRIPKDPAAMLLLARTQLALGMTTEALDQVAATAKVDEGAREVAAQAYAAAGNDLGQADILEPGDPRVATALGRGRDWLRLAQTGDGPWAALAKDMVDAVPATDGDPTVNQPIAGPLSRSADLVVASGQTRERIQALLANVGGPDG